MKRVDEVPEIGSPWNIVAANLEAEPGQWFDICAYDERQWANQARQSLTRRRPNVKASVRKREDGYHLYARWNAS